MKELVVYTNPNCEDSNLIIAYLIDNQFPFRQVDVSTVEEKEALFIQKFPSVVFEQDGFPDSYVEGYDPAGLVKVLNKFRTKKCGSCREREK